MAYNYDEEDDELDADYDPLKPLINGEDELTPDDVNSFLNSALPNTSSPTRSDPALDASLQTLSGRAPTPQPSSRINGIDVRGPEFDERPEVPQSQGPNDFEENAIRPPTPATQVQVKRSAVATTPNASPNRYAAERSSIARSNADAATKQLDVEKDVATRNAEIDNEERSKQETALFNKRLKLDNIQRKRQSDLDSYNQQTDARVKQLEEFANAPDAKIDRNRWMNERSGIQKVLAYVAAGLGAGDVIQGQIDKDIKLQQNEIENTRQNKNDRRGAVNNLLEINRQKFNTNQEAQAATELQLIEGYRDELEAAKLKAGSERQLNNLNKELASLDQRKVQVQNDLRSFLNDQGERQANQNAQAASKRAEAEQLAQMGIFKIGDKHYQLAGTDESGQPILKNLGEGAGAKQSEGSMKLNSTIAATDKIVSDLNKIDPNTILPEQGNIVQRNYQAGKEYLLGRQARGLSPDQQKLTNAQQAAMGMMANLRESGVINEGERPDIEKAILSGTAKDLAFALSALNEVTKAKRKARGD
jgi:hypothetical protein